LNLSVKELCGKLHDVKTEKPLSPEEIAEKVEKYEKVITVEPSLADAVNSRLEEEKVFTPRQLVDSGRFRKELFLKIVEETYLTWKQASYLLDSVLECWKYTGEKDNILEYEKFDSEEMRKVLEMLEEEETPYDRMEKVELEGEIAVLKERQFTAVDRKVLPEEYVSILVFSGESELPEFKIFRSASEIGRAVKQQVERLGPEKIGVAVKPGSSYEPVLKSMLESSGIDYRRSSDLQGNEEFRTFLLVLEAGVREKKVRVSDVRPIIEHLGLNLSRRHENKKFENVSGAEELREFLNVFPYLDYREAARKYLELTDEQIEIYGVLDEMGILDEQICQEYNNALRYFVENFPVGLEEVEEGVLLADPTEVSQIDREYVFHLGMDNDWRRKVSERPWTPENLEESHLKDFKSLIQSGTENFYLVRDKEMNDEINPCLYFNSIFDEFSSFSDLPHKRVRPEKEERENGFEKKDVEIENDEIETGEIERVSQAELNSFAMSPRLYYIQQLVSESDQVKFRKGNFFHDYAEFHATNPEKASELSIEEIVDFMLSEIEELAEETEIDNLETEFRIGVQNLRNFLSERKLPRKPIDGYKVKSEENEFVKKFGGGNRSAYTEPYISDRDLGVKGKVDLVLGENHLVDYKSGRKKSRRKVMKKSNVELHEEEKFPDFQPLIYITYHRKFHPDKEIKFTFLYFLNELGKMVNGEKAETETTIKYYPENFSEKKASMDIFEKLIKDVAKSNDRRKTLEKLGFQKYSEFMKENSARFFDKEDVLQTELREDFEEYAKQRVGDYKYVQKGVEKTLKKLVDIRIENYFKEDADKFEEFLQEKIQEINEYRETRFPIDAKPDELPMRDMILK
jgi:hypothetical protein